MGGGHRQHLPPERVKRDEGGGTRGFDFLNDPLPHYGVRFRELSLVEQNEVMFRFLEEIFDELRAVRAHLSSGTGSSEGREE